MRLHFLMAAAPTAAFCSQIAIFKRGLDHLGPPYSTARLTAVFGDDKITTLPPDWVPHMQGIEIIFADPADFAKNNAFAQGDLRFKLVDPEADLALMFDADTLLLRPIPELLEASLAQPALRGMIAHRSPFSRGGSWDEISAQFPDISLTFDHHYLLEFKKHKNDRHRVPCPFYINQGVMCATPDIFLELGPKMQVLRQALVAHWPNMLLFSSQIALTLAFAKHAVPRESIPMRYNFANRPYETDAQYPEELNQIAVLHYQDNLRFDRHKIFTTRANFDDFMSLSLTGSDQIFQNHVKTLTGGTYPFS